MKNLRDELEQMRFDMGLRQKVYCKGEEEKQFRKMDKSEELPEDVNIEGYDFFRYVNTDLNKEEVEELFKYRQLSYLKSIRNSLWFFVALTVISVVLLLLIR